MAGINAHGATFTFNGKVATVLGIQVETPTAEVVDMTSMTAAASIVTLVPTGAFSPGSITVDCLTTAVPSTAEIGTVGPLSFSSPRFSVTRRGILESATVEARTGELVRGTLKFRLTDYTG